MSTRNHSTAKAVPHMGPVKGTQRMQTGTFQRRGFQQWAEHLSHAVIRPGSPPGERMQDSGSRYLFSVSGFQRSACTKKFMATSSINTLATSPREERQSEHSAVTALGWTDGAALEPLALLCTAFAFPLSNRLPPGTEHTQARGDGERLLLTHTPAKTPLRWALSLFTHKAIRAVDTTYPIESKSHWTEAVES